MNRRIPDQQIAQITQATDLVELVRERVDLTHRGKNWIGLCPFHGEKSPSFNVSPEMGIYKCFGCGKAGGAFTFLMEMDSLSFPEAAAELARRAGIALEGVSLDDPHEPLRRAVAWAAERFREHLQGPQGAPAREYLAGRGFEDATLERFGIGFAPPGWDHLLVRARRDGIDPGVLEEAGLVKRRKESDSLYDAFRERVIFPIADARGRVIAFGGRVMPGADKDTPKYINSPESPLYKKSQVLYGHAQGREAIRRAGRVIIVEGYTDVCMAHQHGVGEVVACCGTSLTLEHAHTLARVAKDQVLFVFDGDGAGVAAAERGLELLLPLGRKIGVVVLPGGADPADLLLESGAAAFVAEVERAQGAFAFKLGQLGRRLDFAQPADKARAVDELLALLARIPNPVERDLTAGDLAAKLGVDPRALTERRRQREASAPASPPRASAPRVPVEAFLLEVLCHRSDLARVVLERYPLGRYRDDRARALAAPVYARVLAALEAGRTDGVPSAEGAPYAAPAATAPGASAGYPGIDELVAAFADPADAALLVEAVQRTVRPEDLDRPLADFLGAADQRDREQRARTLKRELAEAEIARDEAKIRRIIQEFDSLRGATYA